MTHFARVALHDLAVRAVRAGVASVMLSRTYHDDELRVAQLSVAEHHAIADWLYELPVVSIRLSANTGR